MGAQGAGAQPVATKPVTPVTEQLFSIPAAAPAVAATTVPAPAPAPASAPVPARPRWTPPAVTIDLAEP